jgi:aminoglycoside phosphotransferase (APT) family kinase protein
LVVTGQHWSALVIDWGFGMLDPERMPQLLGEFLAHKQPAWRNIKVSSYEVMTGGYSRLLAKATVTHDDGHEVLVLRGDPPSDKVLIHTDRELEWDLVRVLNAHGIRTPVAHYFDHTGEHLGTKALVIDFSHATSFLPYVAAGGAIDGLPTRLAEALASYHAIPLEELPAQLGRPASWDAYLTDRIDEWRRTADAHVEDLPILRYMAGWLDAHRPAPVPLTLMHGDFQSANLMITDDGHFEILDWELASIGDPREDMGYFKAVAQVAPPDLLDDAGCEEMCARYRELTGLTELEVNPVVVAYFLILGVVGTVRRLLEGGADYARGTNHLMGSVFNMNSVQFGQSMWLSTADALGPVLDQLAAAQELAQQIDRQIDQQIDQEDN